MDGIPPAEPWIDLDPDHIVVRLPIEQLDTNATNHTRQIVQSFLQELNQIVFAGKPFVDLTGTDLYSFAGHNGFHPIISAIYGYLGRQYFDAPV